MAKRFKLRISRVLPSFQSCRSKDSSTLPSNPVPSFLRLPPLNPNLITVDSPAPSSKPHHSSLKRHVSSAFISVGCGFRSAAAAAKYLSDEDSRDFQWKQEEKWHVVAKVYEEAPRRKIYNSSVSGDSDDYTFPPAPPPTAEKKKRRAKKKKTTSKIRTSTSSADSGLFSSEGHNERDEEETETLVSSSRSFSTDSSSEFNPHLETIRETPFNGARLRKKKKKNKKVKRCVSKAAATTSPATPSPARLSMFQRLIPCTVEGKVRESFAVVKKSEDPFEDFKRSMMEMILEKQMFEEKDLEQLLHCFLSLNSRHHHGIIVEAFTEIWEAIFCRKSTGRRSSFQSSLKLINEY